MRFIVNLLFISGFSVGVYAQSELLPNALRVPNVTTAQRTGTGAGAITSPKAGMIVFDTNTKSMWYYTGNAWSSSPLAAAKKNTYTYSLRKRASDQTGILGQALAFEFEIEPAEPGSKDPSKPHLLKCILKKPIDAQSDDFLEDIGLRRFESLEIKLTDADNNLLHKYYLESVRVTKIINNSLCPTDGTFEEIWLEPATFCMNCSPRTW